VILLCAAAIALLALPTVARNTFGIGITTVITGSMRPAINPGDLVVTKRSAASTVGIGDVIVAQAGTMAFAHRVVDVRPISGLTRLTTRGDANPTTDIDPVMVSPQQGVERIIWRVPGIGAPLAFLASPEAQRLGLSLLVAANLIALTLFATRRRAAPEPGDAQPARGGVI
jgi:signal peptidase